MERKVYLVLTIAVLVLALLACGCSDRGAGTQAPAPARTVSAATVPGVQVFVSYDGAWQGAIGVGGNIRSVSGTGSQMYNVTFPDQGMRFVSVNAQKMDGSTGRLRVNIRNRGELVATEYTEAPYGVAMTSASF